MCHEIPRSLRKRVPNLVETPLEQQPLQHAIPQQLCLDRNGQTWKWFFDLFPTKNPMQKKKFSGAGTEKLRGGQHISISFDQLNKICLLTTSR